MMYNRASYSSHKYIHVTYIITRERDQRKACHERDSSVYPLVSIIEFPAVCPLLFFFFFLSLFWVPFAADLNRSERFIRISSHFMHLHIASAIGVMGTQGFVVVGGLFDVEATRARLSREATAAEQPEETGHDAESNSQPGDGQKMYTNVRFDVVLLQFLTDVGANDIHENGCNNDRRGEEKESNLKEAVSHCLKKGNVWTKDQAYCVEDVRYATAPATENGGNAAQQLNYGGRKGDDEGYDNVPGGSAIQIDILLVLFRQMTLNGLAAGSSDILDMGDFGWIEPEVDTGLGARGSVEGLSVDVSIAIAQDTDRVEILDIHLV